MKSGKRPTKRQKEVMLSTGINPNNWLVVKSQPDLLTLMHRETGQTKEVPNV